MHAQEVTVALGHIKIYFFLKKNRVVFKQPMKNSCFYNHSIAAVSKIVLKVDFVCLKNHLCGSSRSPYLRPLEGLESQKFSQQKYSSPQIKI